MTAEAVFTGPEPPAVVSLEIFSATEEDGATALLGTKDNAVFPEGGDVMFYGGGGAGKTTLANDVACHLAAGDDWLGIHVERPLTVLMIENEGPRPLFRVKLRAKHNAWSGSPLGERLLIWENPWASFSFANSQDRCALAEVARSKEVDIVIVGPLTASGMEEAGTLQEVRAFAALLENVRQLAGRRLTFVLVHHENKGSQVSGAWEGCGDTLIHVQGLGHGRTKLYFQKARWASEYHGTSLDLVWTDGEGFAVEEKPELDDATLADQILGFLSENPGSSWTKVVEATPGAGRQRRMQVRDGLFAANRIVNVLKEKGREVALRECPERRSSRLYLSDDPSISRLLPGSGADGEQSAPAWGAADPELQLLPAPHLKRGAGAVGAATHPLESGVGD